MEVSEINGNYIYRVGYYSYEESRYIYMISNKKYTDDEFKDIVFKAVENVLKKTKEGKIKNIPACYSFEEILDDVIDELTTSFGFKLLTPTTSWDCFGWPSILNKDHWASDRSSLEELTIYLNERGYTPKSMDEITV